MTTFDTLTDQPVDHVTQLVAAVRSLMDVLPDRPSRLRLSVGQATVDVAWPEPAPAPAWPPGMPSTTTTTTTAPEVGPVTHDVVAPSVGTFYRAPEPGATPFVVVGDVVRPGQQIGIVEAMKLMMPVEADRAGRVGRVLDDGVAVEYGTSLVTLLPLDD